MVDVMERGGLNPTEKLLPATGNEEYTNPGAALIGAVAVGKRSAKSQLWR